MRVERANPLIVSENGHNNGYVGALRTNRMLHTLGDEEIAHLMSIGQWVIFEQDELICRQATLIGEVHFLVEGRAKADVSAPKNGTFAAVLNDGRSRPTRSLPYHHGPPACAHAVSPPFKADMPASDTPSEYILAKATGVGTECGHPFRQACFPLEGPCHLDRVKTGVPAIYEQDTLPSMSCGLSGAQGILYGISGHKVCPRCFPGTVEYKIGVRYRGNIEEGAR